MEGFEKGQTMKSFEESFEKRSENDEFREKGFKVVNLEKS
jgi:hypothetical protein